MSKRMRQKVYIDGEERWISGYSAQELLDNYVKLLSGEGKVEILEKEHQIPKFGDYLHTFYDVYKQDQEETTIVNRERIIKNHVLPRFGHLRIDKIQTSDLQRYFNNLGMKYAKETALKVKNIMCPVLDSAVEDNLITRNPLRSSRLVITGKETRHHKAIPRDAFNRVKKGIGSMPWRERCMGGLLCYTGMRFEEVLGLQWTDISDGWITVQRAVVHPNRNQPVVKVPKTKTSERRIPLNDELKSILNSFHEQKTGYLLFPKDDPQHTSPLSYTESRRSFDKIRKQFGICEYSAHDFRDTCATVWRENGISLDVIARLLGHSKTETTEQRYVKYREDMVSGVKSMM